MAVPYEVLIVNPAGTGVYRIKSDELEANHKLEPLDPPSTEMNARHISSMHIPFKDLAPENKAPGTAGFFGTYYVNLHVIMGRK